MSENLNNVEDIRGKFEDTQKDKYLNFVLEDQVYSIDIKYVIEIIGMQPITHVPELPDYLNGIINLRGKIIPVMDVRVKFKKARAEYNELTCVIVVEYEEFTIGLIADRVTEVLRIKESTISPPPKVNNKIAANDYVKGISKVNSEVKLIMDIEKLLEDENKHSDTDKTLDTPLIDRRSR